MKYDEMSISELKDIREKVVKAIKNKSVEELTISVLEGLIDIVKNCDFVDECKVVEEPSYNRSIDTYPLKDGYKNITLKIRTFSEKDKQW